MGSVAGVEGSDAEIRSSVEVRRCLVAPEGSTDQTRSCHVKQQ